MDWIWQLAENSCTGCGICFDVCPVGAISMTRDMALPQAVPGACTGCMTCADECPFEAIEVLSAPVDDSFPLSFRRSRRGGRGEIFP